MESTKGKVNMHFEKIAIEVDYTGHDLFQEVFCGGGCAPTDSNPGLQAPPRKSQRERSVL
jgi:hypothetical protein